MSQVTIDLMNKMADDIHRLCERNADLAQMADGIEARRTTGAA